MPKIHLQGDLSNARLPKVIMLIVRGLRWDFARERSIFSWVQSKKINLYLGKYMVLDTTIHIETFKCVGSHTYKFDILALLKVHNVFHVSLLEPYIFSSYHVPNDKKVVNVTQKNLELQLDRILKFRERTLRNRVIHPMVRLSCWRYHVKRWSLFVSLEYPWDEDIFNPLSWGGCNVLKKFFEIIVLSLKINATWVFVNRT